jgi:CubicO group peptidase (beta-lactamase class C family)
MKRFFLGALFCTIVLLMASYKVNQVAVAQNGDLNSQCRRDYQVSMLNLLMDSIYGAGRYNGVVLVGDQGRVVFKKAMGYSKVAPYPAFTAETAMQLASVSKPFTAIATLMLIERGAINYDDDIRNYLPSLKYKGITIRHLLNHTSGLPDYLNRPRAFQKYIKESATKELTNQDLLQILAKGKISLEFVPGAQHRYSNTGYALLPLIIENVTGQKFTDFVHEYVFHRVGMKNTFFYSPDKHISRLRENEIRDGVLGDKGVFSTVDDMFLWDQALYTEKLVKQSTLEDAFQQGSTVYDQKFNYGYGWRLTNTEDGGRVIYHKGYWQGATPMLIRYVDKQRTVISLHHANRFDSWFLANSVNYILAQSEFKCQDY